MILGISGTPGTGKTVVGKIVAERLGVPYIDLSSLVKRKKLHSGMDKKRGSFVVSRQKLLKEFKRLKQLHEDLVVEGHFVEEVHPDTTVVLRCRPDVLEKRLKRREYPFRKIRENVLAEILDVCSVNAGSSIEIETHNRSPKEAAKLVERIWHGKKPRLRQVSYFSYLPAFLKKKHC